MQRKTFTFSAEHIVQSLGKGAYRECLLRLEYERKREKKAIKKALSRAKYNDNFLPPPPPRQKKEAQYSVKEFKGVKPLKLPPTPPGATIDSKTIVPWSMFRKSLDDYVLINNRRNDLRGKTGFGKR